MKQRERGPGNFFLVFFPERQRWYMDVYELHRFKRLPDGRDRWMFFSAEAVAVGLHMWGRDVRDYEVFKNGIFVPWTGEMDVTSVIRHLESFGRLCTSPVPEEEEV